MNPFGFDQRSNSLMDTRFDLKKCRWACVGLGVASALFLSGCSSSAGVQTVPRSTAGKMQQVASGTVVATRTVVVDGEATYIGHSSGAVVGSAVGQTVGRGSGRTLATAGGAVVGGIVGGMVEKEMTKKTAQELTIDLDDSTTIVVIQEMKNGGFFEGDKVRVTHTPSGEAYVTNAVPEYDGIY